MRRLEESSESGLPEEAQPHSPPENGGMQLIARVAAVLRALAAHPDGISLRQLARASGLPRATVQRIVEALEKERLVSAGGARAGVRLGPEIKTLAAAMRDDFVEIVRPHLERLAAELRETVILTALSGWRAVYVDQVISDRQVNLSVNPGAAFALHATAAGKALLATLPPEALREFLTEPREAYTSQTILSEEALIEELDDVARLGFACDRRETGDHNFAIATAVFDSAGRPYSISIILPESRSPEVEPTYVGPLLRCRDRIMAAIGTRRAGSARRRIGTA